MASIFSMIKAGDIPGNFVWKDEVGFAILTIQPINQGHLLVIPNEEVDHWDDLEPSVAAHLMNVSQTLAKALKVAFPSKRVGLVIAGLEVPHTHIHLFPVNELADFDFALAKDASADDLAKAATSIKAALEAQSINHGC